MSTSFYYTNQLEPPNQNNDFQAAFLGSLSQVVAGLTNIPGDEVILNLTFGSLIAGTLQVSVDTASVVATRESDGRISLNAKLGDGTSVQIGDGIYPADVVIDSTITTAATLGLTALLGLNPLSVMAIGIAGVVGYSYSRFLDPLIETQLDLLAGTVDVDVRLKDTNGEVLGGALWKDGIYGLTHLQAAMDLVNEAVSQGLTSDITSGMQVEVITGSAPSGDVFTVNDDGFLLGIAELMGISTRFYESVVISNYAVGDLAHLSDLNIILTGENAGFNVNGKIFKPENILYGSNVLIGDYAENDDNLIIGSTGADSLLSGNAGQDYIYGRGGDDHIDGGAGNDIIYGALGDSYIAGGSGIDTVDYSGVSGGISVVFTHDWRAEVTKLATGEKDILESIEVIIGTNSADTFEVGRTNRVVLDGLDGQDTVAFTYGIDSRTIGDLIIEGPGFVTDSRSSEYRNMEIIDLQGYKTTVYVAALGNMDVLDGSGNVTMDYSGFSEGLHFSSAHEVTLKNQPEGDRDRLYSMAEVVGSNKGDFIDHGLLENGIFWSGTGDDVILHGPDVWWKGSKYIYAFSGGNDVITTSVVEQSPIHAVLEDDRRLFNSQSLQDLDLKIKMPKGFIEDQVTIEYIQNGTSHSNLDDLDKEQSALFNVDGVFSLGHDATLYYAYPGQNPYSTYPHTNYIYLGSVYESHYMMIDVKYTIKDTSSNPLGSILVENVIVEFLAGTDGLYNTADDVYGVVNIPEVLYADLFDNNATPYADTLRGVTYGGGGDDHMTVSNDVRTLYGGYGNDRLFGYIYDDTLIGGPGDDTLYGGRGSDYFVGGEGSDTFYGDATDGSDIYYSNDVVEYFGRYSDYELTFRSVYSSQPPYLFIKDLNHPEDEDMLVKIEQIIFSDGTISDINPYYPEAIQLIPFNGPEGYENVSGTSTSEMITGGNFSDNINAGAGNDTIYGLDGDDLIKGDNGADIIYGGSGNNILYGGEGKDTYVFDYDSTNTVIDDGAERFVFLGRTSDQVLITRAEELIGSDYVFAFTDRETSDVIARVTYSSVSTSGLKLDFENATNNYIYNLIWNYGAITDGGDYVYLPTSLIGSSVDLKGGNDQFYGGDGDDYVRGGSGNDTINGMAGDGDTSRYDAPFTNYTLSDMGSYWNVVDTVGTEGTDRLYDIEYLEFSDGWYNLVTDVFSQKQYASAGNDVYAGTGERDMLIYELSSAEVHVNLAITVQQNTDGSGFDTISGFENLTGSFFDDKLWGSNSDNTLKGLDGNDMIHGSGGQDTIYGGNGRDDLNGGFGNDVVYGDAGDDLLYGDRGADLLRGGVGNDYLNGGDGSDTLYGDSGNDTLLAGLHNDVLYGGTGDDILYAGSENDLLYGESGHDELYGGMGDDVLYGGSGNDFLIGGFDQDTLYGEAGADTFGVLYYDVYIGYSDIMDFSLGEGDRIDISDVLNSSSGTYDMMSAAILDFVQLTQSGADTILGIDLSGSGTQFKAIATLHNITGMTDVQQLVTDGTIVV